MQYESLEQARSLYHQAKEAYYNGTMPIMEDWEFDELELYLIEHDPIFEQYVGASSKENKHKHWTPMLSLDKISLTLDESDNPNYTALYKEFKKWLPYNGIVLEQTPKFDGIAINMQYVDGVLFSCITRGDKLQGIDIQSKISHLIPQTISINGKVEIRGEIVMRVAVFEEKYKHLDFKNPRNLVWGILSTKNIDVDLTDIEVVPFEVRKYTSNLKYEFFNTYQLIELFDTEFHMSNSLNSSSEYLNSSVIHTQEDFEKLMTDMQSFREHSGYPLDGCVVKVGDNLVRATLGDNGKYPAWGIAIKFIPKSSETQILDIVWKLGKTGEFTPVATMTPVDLDGSVVQHATLHNLGKVMENKTWSGAKVRIEKKGDIIPQVVEVITPALYETEYPQICSCCGHSTIIENDIKLMCSNSECSGVETLKFVSALLKLEFDYLGQKNAERIAASNFFTDVYECFDMNMMTVNNLVSHCGFSDGKIARHIVEGFNKKRSIDISTIILLMEINSLGKRMATALGKFYSYDFDDFTNFNKSIIESFRGGEYNIRLANIINRLYKCGIEVNYMKEEVSSDVMYFEMTGSPKESGYSAKKDFIEFAFKYGYVHKSLNKECAYLITDDLESTTSKITKANKLGIPIITYQQFKEMVV